MEIKNLKNHSINTDEETLEQIKNCITYEFVLDAALMPDAHRGYVAPIGSVILTKDYVVPSWVGYDIGCGVLGVKFVSERLLNKIKSNREQIFKKVKETIPMGKGVYNEITNLSRNTKKRYLELLEMYKDKLSKDDLNFFKQKSTFLNLGTLGSGNHFIELGYSDYNKRNNEIWLIIHSGSRNIGHHIAEKYMKIAKKINLKDFEDLDYNNIEETFPLKVSQKEANYYLEAHNFCLEFSKLNREEIVYKIQKELEKLFDIKINLEVWANPTHNHLIELKNQVYFNELNLSSIKNNSNKTFKIFIHRKGATSANKDERGIIPGNMRDGSYLVIGLGNKDYLMSSSHGAGRILSRKEAKKKISLESYKKTMEGVVANVIEKTLDESPFAYKKIKEVLNKQKDSVKITNHIKPLINWKG